MSQQPSPDAMGALRRARHFFRATALTVIATLLTHVGMPTAVAAREAAHKTAVEASLEPSARAELGQAVKQAQTLLERLRTEFARPGDERDARAIDRASEQLNALYKRLKELDQKARGRLEAREQRLREQDLPEAILERHNEDREQYRQRMDALLEGVRKFRGRSSDDDRKEMVHQLLDQLSANSKARQAGGDPEKASQQRNRQHRDYNKDALPARGLHKKADDAQKPRMHQDDFRSSGLFGKPRAKLASHGDYVVSELAGASDPAWREATPEVTLTHAIQDKAAALKHDPVKIHAWVRNNVQWIPTWGATQSAEHTLSSRRGNAFDIAALEIALLRASDIPARYAHGTISVEAERFRNWAGGFDSVEAAADYAASGGIPITTVTDGGKITRVRLENVWVEAAVDYFPSRAAVNKSADSWIPLDAAFKQYEYIEGLDIAEVTGLDPQSIAQDFTDSGTIDEQAGFVQGLDPSILANAQQDARTALEDHIQNELPDDATVADVIGGRRIIEQDYNALPGSIPNQLVTMGARYAELPNKLRHQLTVGLGVDVLGDPINTVTLPWAEANGARLTVAFSPATEEDRQALKSLLPDGEITDPSQLPDSIPSSLVRLQSELRLNGEVIQTGPVLKPGEELDFAYTVQQRGYGPQTEVSPVIAGSFLHLAVAGGSVSPDQLENLQSRVENTRAKLESEDEQQIASLTRDDLLGDLFQAGGMAYFGQFDAMSQVQARQQQARQNLAPSVGTYGYEPRVASLFGLPNAIEPGGVAMDMDRVAWVEGANQATETTRKQRTIQTGALSSGLEHAVPEQMFSTEENQVEAISAVKALGKANRQGQKIYEITEANRADVLPRLNHQPETMDEIRAALDAGKTVTTHTDPVSVPGWQGAGYVILDPETGDGAWKIGGGKNGGFVALFAGALLLVFALFLLTNPAVLAAVPFLLGPILTGGAVSMLSGLLILLEKGAEFDLKIFSVARLLAGVLLVALFPVSGAGGFLFALLVPVILLLTSDNSGE